MAFVSGGFYSCAILLLLYSMKVDGVFMIQNPPAENFAGNFASNFASEFCEIFFFAHLIVLAGLITYLSIRGYNAENPTFHPTHYYIPLLTSIALSAITALLWVVLTLWHPKEALTASRWFSPFLTCLAGFLLLANGTPSGLVLFVLALVIALILALYACWIKPHLPHAYRILEVSIPTVWPSFEMGKYITLALATAVIYSSIWTLGVGGIAAGTVNATRFDALFILLLLLSLSWTMQVIQNVVHVAVSRVVHVQLVRREEVSLYEAFGGAGGRAIGDVCFGSAVAPVVELVRETARAMPIITEGQDEFLCSFANCGLRVADRMVAYGNRWGFVHVGVYSKGFVRASKDTWALFRQRGMGRLIDKDLTGSFCFLCGVAGGAMSALVGGLWVLLVDKSCAMGVTLYAFLIGYFMFRIAMSWPQACISAYHVVYAEGAPHNDLLDSTIPDRILALQPPQD